MNRTSNFVALCLAIALVGAACGDAVTSVSADSSPPATGATTTTVATSSTTSPTTAPEDATVTSSTIASSGDQDGRFIGLDIDTAGALAESTSQPWRIGREDDEIYALTEDYVVGRVTFELDNGLVTSAHIEGEIDGIDPDSPAVVTGPPSPELVSAAIVRIVTKDNSFGEGVQPFDVVYLANLLTATFEEIDERSIDAAVDALVSTVDVEVIADAEGKITDLFSAEGTDDAENAAVVSVEDVRIDGATAEVDMALWCGSLCGIWLTYTAELVAGTWSITGTTGPIAVS